MGAINIGSRGGGNVKLKAPDGAKAGTEVTLPKEPGTLATLEDVDRITDLDKYMPKTGGKFTGKVKIDYHEDGYYSYPLEIIGDYGISVLKFWSHGGIETTYKNFEDNELVTKAYVDSKTDRDNVACEQFWNNASWDTNNMVDALVSQIKVHNDRTALVLNKNGTDTTITKDWENELAPYPSYFGIKIADEIYYVEVEFKGKGGTNNRGYNFKILSHNLPETVANGTVVGICTSYTPEPLTVADYDNFMPDGGTFTGDVKHKKDIIIEPTLPNRFVNIKNRYATDANGNNSGGSDNTQFGINFDLDNGNSGYNTVQWSTRNGNVFAVYGGTQANAKYRGVITEGTHLVNKHYVDNRFLPLTGGELDGALTIKKNTQVALDIIGDNNNSQIKFWSSGAVQLPNYTDFKDNELVTKAYVDGQLAVKNTKIQELEDRLNQLEKMIK